MMLDRGDIKQAGFIPGTDGQAMNARNYPLMFMFELIKRFYMNGFLIMNRQSTEKWTGVWLLKARMMSISDTEVRLLRIAVLV